MPHFAMRSSRRRFPGPVFTEKNEIFSVPVAPMAFIWLLERHGYHDSSAAALLILPVFQAPLKAENFADPECKRAGP